MQGGWLRTLLGDPEQATLRGGYSVAYERQGLGNFTGVYGGNPGSTVEPRRATRPPATSVGPGETWPVLLSQTERLYTAPFPRRRPIPIAAAPNRADGLNAFAPDIEIALRAHLDGQLPALDLAGHGGRRPLRRHPRRQPVVDASTTTTR